jgi:SSS family solute:Na+ symporter
MTIATWLAFLAYSLAAIVMGWRASRRQNDADFWTAGRGLSSGSVGLSLSAGFLSISWSCVYAVQLFYWYGAGGLLLMTLPWLAALAGIYWLARRYHALDAFSQPEMVGARFGIQARRVVAVALAFVFLVWGGAEIYVAATLLAPAMAVPGWTLIVMIGAIVAIYSVLGGFAAVVNTDRLQYGIVVLYILTMAWLALRGLRATDVWLGSVDGAGAAWQALLQQPITGARSGTSWTGLMSAGLATVVLTFVAYLPGWLFETDLWIRVQAARDPRAARRGIAFAAINAALFVGLVPMFIGVSALVLFPPVDGTIPPELGNEGDAIFAALVATYAPPWLAVLVAIGLVAAAMSTIDTCTNVVSLSIDYDILGQPPGAGAAGAGRARAVTVASVAAACLFALNTESLWDIFYLSSGVLTTAVAFPVAAVFLPRVQPRAVVWSSVAGFGVTVAAYFLEASGSLAAVEPGWLADSGIGYILWGLAGAAAAGLFGQAAAPR